jgi:hypothetical protein
VIADKYVEECVLRRNRLLSLGYKLLHILFYVPKVMLLERQKKKIAFHGKITSHQVDAFSFLVTYGMKNFFINF